MLAGVEMGCIADCFGKLAQRGCLSGEDTVIAVVIGGGDSEEQC